MEATESLKKAIVCEPLKDGIKLYDRILQHKPTEIWLCFWHGVGDLVMFLPCFYALQDSYPNIKFAVALPDGLTHEELLPKDIPFVLVSGREVNETTEDLPVDMFCKITFPMNEGQSEYTKAEWCCIHELGIPPVWGHLPISKAVNRLCSVHFQITCLPDSCNPDRDTAEKIWNEILEAGWIPIEAHFQHIFHNPVNEKFDFVDATVRRARPRVSSLVGLLRASGAFVGVVSGPFHVALSVLPPARVFLLEKDFKREHFTKNEIAHLDLRNYQPGQITKWLSEI